MARGVEIPITATDRTGQAFQSVQRRMARFERSAKALRQAAVGFAAIGAAAGASIQRVVAVTDRIGKAAQTAGVSAESLQELRFAFGQLAGTTTRDVDLSLQRFNRRLGLAQTGTKTYADAFEQLGVSINQGTQPALRAALVSLAQIESASERAATASQLFGEEAGPKIASALSQGIDAVDQLAASLPGMITDENVARAAELNDAMDALSQQFTAEFANAVLDNSESFLELGEAMGDIATFAVNAADGFVDFGQGLGEAAAKAQLALRDGSLAQVARVMAFIQNPGATLGSMAGGGLDLGPTRGAEGGARGPRESVLDYSDPAAVFGRAGEDAPPLPAPQMPATPQVPSLDFIGEAASQAPDWEQGFDEFFASFDRGRQVLEELRTPTENYAADVQELVDLLAQGGLTSDEFQQALQRMGERFAKEQESGAFPELQNALTQSILAGVEGGANGALDVFANLLQQMAMEALQSQLSGALANLFPGGGGGGGGVGGFLGGLFGGARAEGGSVTGGRTYLVGERGPELFTAGRTGTITPNDAMGGGLTYAPVVTIQGGATEQDRILFQRQLDQQKAEIFDLARRGRL